MPISFITTEMYPLTTTYYIIQLCLCTQDKGNGKKSVCIYGSNLTRGSVMGHFNMHMLHIQIYSNIWLQDLQAASLLICSVSKYVN